MLKKNFLILVMIFAILGIILAGALTLAKYNQSIALLCGDNVDNECNIVQNSEYSYLINIKDEQGKAQFQVPLSLAGVLFYAILLVTSFIMYRRVDDKDSRDLKYFLFVIGLFGVAFSAAYTWIQAYKIEAFCTYCLISAFDSLVIFVLVTLIAFYDKEGIKKKLKKKVGKKSAN